MLLGGYAGYCSDQERRAGFGVEIGMGGVGWVGEVRNRFKLLRTCSLD